MLKKLLFLLIASLLAITTHVYANSNTRIIGGEDSAIGAWPSAVALISRLRADLIETGLTGIDPADANFQSQACGGSLLSSRWVLTAAHCLVQDGTVLGPDRWYVLAGTNNLVQGGERVTVSRVVIHPDYDPVTDDADIALLELSTAVSAAPVSVYADDVADCSNSTVVGWGRVDVNNENLFSQWLQEVDVPVIPRSACSSVYQSNLTQNMFCAGVTAGGKDSCQGDSGGPLYVNIDGIDRQVGVVSWGVDCAQPDVYGIYTRLSQFTQWIIDTTGVSGAVVTSSPGKTDVISHCAPSDSGSGVFWLPLLGLLLFRRKILAVFTQSIYRNGL